MDLVAFTDGELGDRAPAFRDHLLGCPGCRDDLVETMALEAHLSELLLGEPRRRWWATAWRRLQSLARGARRARGRIG